MPAEIELTPTLARRLAITRQGLNGPQTANGQTSGLPRPPTADDILALVRELGCLQLDPVRAVERTQYLVLWSRLGQYDPADLDRLLWQERRLFEYWAHAASIVLIEDFPIYRRQMRDWGQGKAKNWARFREWLAENSGLRDAVLAELRERGPLSSDQLTDNSERPWRSTGWTKGRMVTYMLDALWLQGEILVAGRRGLKRFWDLSGRCLPPWTPAAELEWPQVVSQAAQRSLRALGVARPAHIQQHFTRGRYPDLAATLKRLEEEGRIARARLVEDGRSWPGPWYVHADDLPLLEQLTNGEWRPRTTLLSPFDNLICDRKRTEQLFGFSYRVEIYVPKAKRQYGYYTLPILHGDRLIGRLDPLMDRQNGRLQINAVFAEPDAPQDGETGRAVAAAIAELAAWLGAKEIAYGPTLPDGWQPALRKT